MNTAKRIFWVSVAVEGSTRRIVSKVSGYDAEDASDAVIWASRGFKLVPNSSIVTEACSYCADGACGCEACFKPHSGTGSIA